MVRTVSPNAKATPRKPIPRFGKPAASTAAPQPPNTSHKVPKNSATTRRGTSFSMGPLPHYDVNTLPVEIGPLKNLGHRVGPPAVTNAQLTGQYDRTSATGWRDVAKKKLASDR